MTSCNLPHRKDSKSNGCGGQREYDLLSTTRQHESTGKSRMGLDAQSPFERLLMQPKPAQTGHAPPVLSEIGIIHFWCAFSTFKLQPGTSHAYLSRILTPTPQLLSTSASPLETDKTNRIDKTNQNEDCSFYSMIFCPRVFKT